MRIVEGHLVEVGIVFWFEKVEGLSFAWIGANQKIIENVVVSKINKKTCYFVIFIASQKSKRLILSYV